MRMGGVNFVPDRTGVPMANNMIIGKTLSSLLFIGLALTSHLGADVGHPGAGVLQQPSVAAVVWSTDPDVSRYTAWSALQPPRQERITQLGDACLASAFQSEESHS